MPKINNSTETKSVVFSREELNNIRLRAGNLGITCNEFIRQACKDYMEKDLKVENALISSLERIESSLNHTTKKVDIFNSVFLYWLKFYFAFSSADFDNLPSREAQNQKLDKGENKRNIFLKWYKRDNQHMLNIYESLLGDFLLEGDVKK